MRATVHRSLMLWSLKSKYLVQLISAVVTRDLETIVRGCDISNWREALTTILTYADGEDFTAYCSQSSRSWINDNVVNDNGTFDLSLQTTDNNKQQQQQTTYFSCIQFYDVLIVFVSRMLLFLTYYLAISVTYYPVVSVQSLFTICYWSFQML